MIFSLAKKLCNRYLPIRLSLLLLACSIYLSSHAQNTGSISGMVVENTNPLEFVTVAVYNASDTVKPIKNTITDSAGRFLVEGLPLGNYFFSVRLIGYSSVQQQIALTAELPHFNTGNILLTADITQLKSVTVTAKKNIIQKTTKGFIVNASANLTQIGGTATDMLRNTPTVVVDGEGVITIRGKTPLILINGRNPGIANTDQIPASSIESIEIITNPSAQYDANTEGGIINILLKKNKQSGSNGAVALGIGAGAKGRINSSVLLSHKNLEWNFALAYDNRFAGRIRNIHAERINFDIPDEYYLNQLRKDDRLDQLQNLRVNIEFAPNTKNSFELEATGNMEGQDNDEDLNNTLRTSAKTFNLKTDRHSIEIERDKEVELALNYSRKFTDKRISLTSTVSTAFNYDRQHTGITSQLHAEDNSTIDKPQFQRTTNYEDGNITNIKIDFGHPVSAKATIETGYKCILRFLNANFQSLDEMNGVYMPNPLVSSNFTFNENVQAAYIQYNSFEGQKDNPKWKYDFGLRAEQVNNNGNVISNNKKFTNNYFNFFPSANIIYYKTTAEFWRIGYSRKINRPGFGQLNPFIDVTDSLNQHGGNPDLKPELIHSFELGYNKDWRNISFYSVLYYRNATNSIRQFSILQPNGVALSLPQNFGNVSSYGIENIFTVKPVSKYDFNFSFSLFKQLIKGNAAGQEVNNNVLSWYGKLINNFILWKGSKLQITGVYNSPVALPQGKRIAVYNVDLGFQQKVGKTGNGRIGLVVTDIFNIQRYGSLLNAPNFSYSRFGKVDSRAVLLTFAYTFGTSFKEKLLENKYSND